MTVPKFEISQSEAVFTVLISCHIKSLNWYGYDIMLTGWNLARFGGKSGSFGFLMGSLAWLRLAKIRLNRARSNSPDMPMKNTMKVRLPVSVTLTCFDKDWLMNEEEEEHSYLGED